MALHETGLAFDVLPEVLTFAGNRSPGLRPPGRAIGDGLPLDGRVALLDKSRALRIRAARPRWSLLEA